MTEEQRGLGTVVRMGDINAIVTSNHVIAGASEIVVTDSNGNFSTAEVVSADTCSDVAVLGVDGDWLFSNAWANSPTAQSSCSRAPRSSAASSTSTYSAPHSPGASTTSWTSSTTRSIIACSSLARRP